MVQLVTLSHPESIFLGLSLSTTSLVPNTGVGGAGRLPGGELPPRGVRDQGEQPLDHRGRGQRLGRGQDWRQEVEDHVLR